MVMASTAFIQGHIIIGKMKKITALSRIPAPYITRDNPAAYIILPGKSHGSYEYPDIEVGMHRLGYAPFMTEIAKALDIGLKNTANEKDGTPYIADINNWDALKLNLSLGNFTLNPRQFIDFKELLEEGIKGKRVYDGNGKRIEPGVLRAVHEEMFAAREPFRGEHLDAHFVENNGVLYFESNHILKGNNLVPTISEVLERKVETQGWIDANSFNHQGLPTKKARKDELCYWSPENETVVRFVAGSGRVGLHYGWYPDSRDAGLGVRPAHTKK